MANNKEEKLFTEFPPVSTEQWEEVIKADLKGADYQKKLVWRTSEGFNVRPYYRAEDLKGIQYLGKKSGEFPYVRGNRCHNRWRIHETIAVKEVKSANEFALHAIEAGAESIGFDLSEKLSAQQVADLMAGIDLNATELAFSGVPDAELPAKVLAVAEAKGAAPDKFRVFFGFDPIIRQLSLKGVFCCGDQGQQCFKTIAELVKTYHKAWPKAKFITVGGETFQNSGSTIVQELAFTLAAGHEYVVGLMDAGLSADEAARTIRFSMGVSSNYFMEMAKFRAGRMLWANIMNAYADGCARKMFTHAVTTTWNITAYDPYVNMLRGTTEAMSASLAGVHSLEVMPFDTAYESPTEFSSRIARNVQLLLKNESHFDNVVDPAGGSYYIENLTASIAEQAWNLFKEVENRGGYIAAFREGFIPDAVKASAEAKDNAVATRRIVLLGTNQYPNFNETADKAITAETVTPAACEGKVLRPYRGGMAFEQLRLTVDRSDKAPRAFMLTCGTLSMARARSQFACNFFACAGIRVVDNTFLQSVEEGAEAAVKWGPEIVVICAADDDYATLAPKAKELLGDKAIFVVAGAPASQPELEAQGITRFISVRSNVLETLKGYVKELGI